MVVTTRDGGRALRVRHARIGMTINNPWTSYVSVTALCQCQRHSTVCPLYVSVTALSFI